LGRGIYSFSLTKKKKKTKIMGGDGMIARILQKMDLLVLLSGHLQRQFNHTQMNLTNSRSQSITGIAERTSSAPVQSYPDEFDKFKKSKYCADIKEVKIAKVVPALDLIKKDRSYKMLLVKRNDKYFPARIFSGSNGWNKPPYLQISISDKQFVPDIKNGSFAMPSDFGRTNHRYEKFTDEEFCSVTLVNDGNRKFAL